MRLYIEGPYYVEIWPGPDEQKVKVFFYIEGDEDALFSLDEGELEKLVGHICKMAHQETNGSETWSVEAKWFD